jgi:hypothetical protein
MPSRGRVSEIGEEVGGKAHGLWAAGIASLAGSVSRSEAIGGEGLVKSQRKRPRKTRQER